MKILTLILLVSLPVFAAKFVAFKSTATYRIEGTIEGKYFLFNRYSSNEQRIKLTSLHDMVHGAQYAICFKVVSDCHMECTGEVISKPKFITPDRDPEVLIPDIKGVYATADSTQCP